MRRGVPVTWLNRNGRALARVSPAASSTGADRLRQVEASVERSERLRLARRFVLAKVHNQRTLLVRRCRRAGLAQPGSVATLARILDRGTTAASIPELFGLEGAAASAYYRTLRLLVPAEAGFQRRDRASRDVVNQATNYASGLLREHLLVPVVAAGLDPGVSFLHEPDPSRPTLVFDLMEEWRAPLVDSVALTLVCRGELGDGDLDEDGRLALDARRRIITRVEERLDQQVAGADGVARTYRSHLSVQVGRLVEHLRGRRDYEGFAWR